MLYFKITAFTGIFLLFVAFALSAFLGIKRGLPLGSEKTKEVLTHKFSAGEKKVVVLIVAAAIGAFVLIFVSIAIRG